MSSLVNVNTRPRSHERLKSAGARLQSSSQSASLSEPSGRQRDLHSSQAALKQHRTETGIPELHVRTPRRRVKSALETRREQEASDIFHQQEKARAPIDPSWGVTKYSEDFGPKARITPVPMRPASATRRNNPHPAQSFMIWQYPVRTHKHHKAVLPAPDTWRFINEGFYEDYTNDYNTGDAKNEVPITNVAKIEFPGSPRKKAEASGAHLVTGVSGTKAQLMPRKKDPSTESKKNFRPASPQSRMIRSTVKESSLPVVKEWLKVASLKERELVLQMLQAGYDNSEDIRMNKALDSVLQPESVVKVQDWLQNASESERQVLLHVLETLVIATDDNKAYLTPGYHVQNLHMNGLGNHYRAYSYPITLRPRRSASHHHSKSYRGQYSKHHHSKHKKQAPETEISSGVFDGKAFGLHGRKMMIQGSKGEKSSTDVNPDIWHNRTLKKHVGAAITHAGGIFTQPQKDRGQHFTHHPEWPTT